MFSSARYTGTVRREDGISGHVTKSGPDRDVLESQPRSYKITGLTGSTLQLDVEDGIIQGHLHRPRPKFDWHVKGSYDASGFSAEINDWSALGVTLTGRFKPR